jgi:integrase
VLTRRDATVRDYRSKSQWIRKLFGDQPVRTLNDPTHLELFHLYLRAVAGRSRDQALANLAALEVQRQQGKAVAIPDGRDALATAAGVMRVLSAFCGWLVRMRHLKANPVREAAGGGLRLPRPRPSPRIASLVELDALQAAAAELSLPHAWFALRLALHTGARPRDLLSLDAATTVSLPDGEQCLRLIASKTGAVIELALTGRLQALLAEIRAHQIERWGVGSVQATGPYLLRDAEDAPGKPYAAYADPVRVWWRDFDVLREHAVKACPSLGTLRFKDLRATAVTMLAEAGCTIPQISSITGHSLAQATQILEHYRAATRAQAHAAQAKMAAHLERLGVRW